MKDRLHNRPAQTLIAILRDAVEAWRKRQGLSVAAVVDEIVATHGRLGLDVVTDIRFEVHREEYRRMETNAARVYRWLDDFTKPNNHLPANFIPSILAALPMDLRIQAVNTALLPAMLSVREIEPVEASPIVASLQSVAKESGEAVASMAALVDGATEGELLRAQRELTESIAAQEAALHQVEKHLVSRAG